MGRVVHFEIFGDDPGMLADFYRDVFGWDVGSWNGPIEYYLASTGWGKPGIDGAIAPRGETGDQNVVLTIDVPDLDRAIADVQQAGGALVHGREAIPGVGWHAYLRDPAGNVFGAMETDRTAGMPAEAETLEAHTADATTPSAAESAVGGEEAPGGPTSGPERVTGAWDDVGERLRDLGSSLAAAMAETVASPQAQRVREEAERAGRAVRDAGAQAADRARPHVVAALDRVSRELDVLAARLRGAAEEAPGGGEPVEPEPGEESTEVTYPEEERPLA